MSSLDEIGPYRIVRLLGRGGMGRVFEGRHYDTEERAAVKLLSPALQDEGSFRDRFSAEIQTLKQLDHPNIVTYLGSGKDGGQLYYAMEYVDGRTLQMEIADKRHFTWREVVNIAIQICGALKHAHDRGIVHRDLKPANLLLTNDNQIKLTDFGIAKLFGAAHLTVDGGVIGTADYMSPEQAESRGATALSDLYSLGGVMYALLAGRPPFASKSVAECLHRLKYETAVEIRRIAPDTPAELEVILSQLLEKDPQKRIPTAIALANRLKSLEFALAQSEPPPITPLMSDQPTDPAERAEVDHDGETRDATSFAMGTSSSAEFGSSALKFGTNLDLEDEGSVVVEEAQPKTGETYYTTIGEEREAARLSARDQDERIAAVARVVMAVVALGLVGFLTYWWINRPPSSDVLFQQIESAMNDSDKDAKIHVAAAARDFVAKFPDDERADKVKKFLKQIRAHRFGARMERVIKFRQDVDDLEPVELDYLHAIRDVTTNPEGSLRKLNALVELYAENADENETAKAAVNAAEELIRQLKSKLASQRDRQLGTITQQLARANRLKKKDAKAAARVYQAIVDLHENSPWAKALVDEAKKALAEGGD